MLRLNSWRGLTHIMKRGVPGPEEPLPKWQWGEINQTLTELAVDILGEDGAAYLGFAVDLPAAQLARQLDRGRHDRDPQEHRGRARARAAKLR